MHIRDCVPKDKFDVDALRKAEALGFPEINSIIPQLLEWIKDDNWPVAAPCATLLAKAGPEIAPHILKITTSDDPIWKYWTIERVIAFLRPDVMLALQNELVRLSTEAEQCDKLEGVDISARNVLASRST